MGGARGGKPGPLVLHVVRAALESHGQRAPGISGLVEEVRSEGLGDRTLTFAFGCDAE